MKISIDEERHIGFLLHGLIDEFRRVLGNDPGDGTNSAVGIHDTEVTVLANAVTAEIPPAEHTGTVSCQEHIEETAVILSLEFLVFGVGGKVGACPNGFAELHPLYHIVRVGIPGINRGEHTLAHTVPVVREGIAFRRAVIKGGRGGIIVIAVDTGVYQRNGGGIAGPGADDMVGIQGTDVIAGDDVGPTDGMVDAGAVCGHHLVVGAVLPEHIIAKADHIALFISGQRIAELLFCVFIGAIPVDQEESPVFVEVLSAVAVAVTGLVGTDIPLPGNVICNDDIQLGQPPLLNHSLDLFSGEVEGVCVGP